MHATKKSPSFHHNVGAKIVVNVRTAADVTQHRVNALANPDGTAYFVSRAARMEPTGLIAGVFTIFEFVNYSENYT